MSSTPLISVIIPVYNSIEYLSQCIESVLQQSYKNCEIILVNDGSTDGSGSLCDNFASEYNRIKVVHQENQGAASARNNGVRHSNGDFLMFLDSDDYWVEESLEKIVKELTSHDFKTDIMFLQVAKIRTDGTLTTSKGYNFDAFNVTELVEYICTQDKVAVSACLKVINRKIVENGLVFEDGLLAEDIDWFFLMLFKAKNFTAYSGDFYCYRNSPNSASKSGNEKRIKDYLKILNRWQKKDKEFQKLGIPSEQLYYMLGYEYEILLATLYNYNNNIIEKYFEEVKQLFWILNYRNNPRTKLIKLGVKLFGLRFTCRILNDYLKIRRND